MSDYLCDSNFPYIPDGVYEAQCIKYDTAFVFVKTKKLFLHFKITSLGEHNGKEIFQAFNMPPDGKIKSFPKNDHIEQVFDNNIALGISY